MRGGLVLLLVLLSSFVFSQAEKERDSPTRNIEALLKLKKEIDKDYALQQKELKEYLSKNDFLLPKDSSNTYTIDGMLNGRPQIKKSMNAGSYSSLGAYAVSPEGDLGLDLGGENLNIVIWDSGVSRRNHQELIGRVNRTDVGAEDDHATHVAGTLIASGVDRAAKGFLYKAKTKTYDFNNDVSEMVGELLSQNLQLSNHSYGLVTGWNQGQWSGDVTISDKEDWRFGFYSTEAKRFDEILFNAPFYSVVMAAGNDRGESGDGTFPPDGPYDIIGGFGTSKNVFTIGAVNKLMEGYTERSDVIMSSFSGWGPTDDGRIKPDFVAPGVNLYSSFSGSDTDYGLSSGTSMASPSAAGAIGLVNEAYFVFNNRYLKSASLKALLAQTVRDAGSAPGPDYSFGWGLIAVDKAVEMILEEDGVNKLISEERLGQGQLYELELNPVENSSIIATIAWTDPAGDVPVTSLDPGDLNLVNDLDIRIVDESGNEAMPWILNPANPSATATKGDNFRDNIEQIEFTVSQPRRYFLRVTHKGNLTNGFQEFSIALEYESEASGVENIYWVDNSGSANSTTHWSAASGGIAGETAGIKSKLIIDNNSFSAGGNTITLSSDLSVNGVIALTSNNFILDLGGNTLTIEGSAFLNSPNYTITNGTLIFSNPHKIEGYTIDLKGSNLENVNLYIGSENISKYSLVDAELTLAELSVGGGTLRIEESVINVQNLNVQSRAKLSSNATAYQNLEVLSFSGDAVIDNNSQTIYSASESENFSYNFNGHIVDGIIQINSAQGSIEGRGATVGQILMTGSNPSLDIRSNLIIENELLALSASTIRIQTAAVLSVKEDISLTNGTQIESIGSGTASIELQAHRAYCFDNLTISNVNLTGLSSVSVGALSTLNNAAGWFAGSCNNLLFADFEVLNACDNALSTLKNKSQGSFNSTMWYVNGAFVSMEESPNYIFKDSITYTVRVEVEDQNGAKSEWEDAISIGPAVVDSNYIIQNSTSLVSFKAADSYTWYKNDILIPNSNSRVLPYDGSLAYYYVVTFKDGCNRVSEVRDFSTRVETIDTPDATESGVSVSPVPASDLLIVKVDRSGFARYDVSIRGYLGQLVLEKRDITSTTLSLDVSKLASGLYVLKIENGEDEILKKIIIAK